MAQQERQQLEQAVLGTLLLNGEKAMGEILPHLTAEDFQNPLIRRLFETALRLYRGKRPIDSLTVLADTQGWEREGLNQACVQAVESVPLLRHLGEYVRQLSEKARLERAKETALQLLSGIEEGQGVEACRSLAGEILRDLEEGAGQEVVPAKDGFLHFNLRKSEKKDYIQTGIGWFDRFIYMDKGDYIIIGGRPSSGKTALTLQIALHMAKKYNVVYFSLETSPEKIYDRLICHYTQTSFTEIKRQEIKDWGKIADCYDRFSKLHLDVVPAAGFTVEQIQSVALQRNAQVVFIDYLTLIKAKGGSLYERATNISMDLHTMAQRMGWLVVALAQLNREGDKAPDMTSIRESGQIEQDADAILLLNQKEKEENRREIILAKSKEGETGKFDFSFDGLHQTFRAIDPRYDDAEAAS